MDGPQENRMGRKERGGRGREWLQPVYEQSGALMSLQYARISHSPSYYLSISVCPLETSGMLFSLFNAIDICIRFGCFWCGTVADLANDITFGLGKSGSSNQWSTERQNTLRFEKMLSQRSTLPLMYQPWCSRPCCQGKLGELAKGQLTKPTAQFSLCLSSTSLSLSKW